MDTDEAGAYEFAVVQPGIVQFEIFPPQGFSVTEDRIERALPEGVNSNGFSANPAFSAAGRFIAFETLASNLGPGDFNLASDIYVFDDFLDTVTRLSFSSFPFTDTNAGSFNATINSSGRFVAYQSAANNIVGDDTNAFDDIYYLDRLANVPMLVSRADDGSIANENSGLPSISGDGLKVAYVSLASNLVDDDTNGVADIFVVTPEDQQTVRVSVSSTGEQANGGSTNPVISRNGRFVVFHSEATNLVPGDTNGHSDIFVYDLESNTIERVNVNDNGEQANDFSAVASISEDGRFVSFESNATNLVPDDTNGVIDVFVYDRLEQTIERVSTAADGTEGDNASRSVDQSMSADGRFIIFASNATNLVESDENNLPDVFVYDRLNNVVEIANVGVTGEQANNATGFAALSPDGGRIAFTSFATNLAEVDTNGLPDVFKVSNPVSEFQAGGEVTPGLFVDDFALGLLPDPGQILGTLFEDVIPNGILDSGETPLADQLVFLDA
ncbi:MAG: hypothetical protein AAF497_27680, partial [Planctomycetota bacterium]